MFQHILVPLDGTATAERAIAVAARLAQAAGGVVTLLRVIHPYWEPDAAIAGWAGMSADDREAVDAADYLAEVRQRDVLADMASFATIAVGAVVPAILKEAQDDHADLIVLCRRRRSRLGHWAHGRITEQVAKRASVPVLVLHQHDDVPDLTEAASSTVRGLEVARGKMAPSSASILSQSVVLMMRRPYIFRCSNETEERGNSRQSLK